MTSRRFDGRVAVVTGAGRGMGRGYALLLAEQGATVIVNDLGASMQGVGADAGVAASVAAEITDRGGAAVADTSDVSDEEGANGLIAETFDRFGRIDILINNAGIIRWADFPDADADDLARHWAVHVGGSFHTARAAWPHLVEQAYGRIVMTTSTGIFGLPNNASYATAKGGVIGLSRSLAMAGAAHGIKVNLIAPAANTRMAGPQPDDEGHMAPGLVAPLVAYLAHEDCPVNGEIFVAGGGRYSRMFIAATPGYVHHGGEPTIDDIAAHWSAITDEAGYYVPADLMAWSSSFLSHLPR